MIPTEAKENQRIRLFLNGREFTGGEWRISATPGEEKTWTIDASGTYVALVTGAPLGFRGGSWWEMDTIEVIHDDSN